MYETSDKIVLTDVIKASSLLTEKKIMSLNLALVLVHDLLFARGIQAGDGSVKQAVLRHKTRLRSELQRIKIKRGVSSNLELANNGDELAGKRYRSRAQCTTSRLRGLLSTDTKICPSEYVSVDNPGSYPALPGERVRPL